MGKIVALNESFSSETLVLRISRAKYHTLLHIISWEHVSVCSQEPNLWREGGICKRRRGEGLGMFIRLVCLFQILQVGSVDEEMSDCETKVYTK